MFDGFLHDNIQILLNSCL